MGPLCGPSRARPLPQGDSYYLWERGVPAKGCKAAPYNSEGTKKPGTWPGFFMA